MGQNNCCQPASRPAQLPPLFLRRRRLLRRARQRVLEKPSGLQRLRKEASADQDNPEDQHPCRHEKHHVCVSRCFEKYPRGKSNGVSDAGEPDEHENCDCRVKEHGDANADAGRYGRDSTQDNWKEGVSVPYVAAHPKSVALCRSNEWQERYRISIEAALKCVP